MPTDFAPGPVTPATPLFAGAALLDAERLDAYRVALEFQAVAGQLVPKRGYSELRDQLERASISIVLNIAEGCGRVSPADKARFSPWRAVRPPSPRLFSTCCGLAVSSTLAFGRALALCSSGSYRC